MISIETQENMPFPSLRQHFMYYNGRILHSIIEQYVPTIDPEESSHWKIFHVLTEYELERINAEKEGEKASIASLNAISSYCRDWCTKRVVLQVDIYARV